jgi:hypothetical protein
MAAQFEFEVIRDQGYGRVYSRLARTRADAERCMANWMREGIEHAHPSLRLGGDFRIQRRNGAEVV